MIYLFWFAFWGYYLKSYTPVYWPGNIQSLIGIFILSIVTFSAAYSNNSLSFKILKGNDISYGIYIYHMLVINTLIQLKYIHYPTNLAIAFLISIVISYLSWIFIEKKFLKLKHTKIL
jgi:peptidoglycan/LPS O-acetylase OafA/YrhL